MPASGPIAVHSFVILSQGKLLGGTNVGLCCGSAYMQIGLYSCRDCDSMAYCKLPTSNTLSCWFWSCRVTV